MPLQKLETGGAGFSGGVFMLSLFSVLACLCKQKNRLLFIFNFNNMRKFIGNSFLFAVFTVIVYLLLIAAYGVMPKKMYKNINYATGAYGHMFSRMSEVKQTKDVDILFLETN